jgi:hypothetical protein
MSRTQPEAPPLRGVPRLHRRGASPEAIPLSVSPTPTQPGFITHARRSVTTNLVGASVRVSATEGAGGTQLRWFGNGLRHEGSMVRGMDPQRTRLAIDGTPGDRLAWRTLARNVSQLLRSRQAHSRLDLGGAGRSDVPGLDTVVRYSIVVALIAAAASFAALRLIATATPAPARDSGDRNRPPSELAVPLLLATIVGGIAWGMFAFGWLVVGPLRDGTQTVTSDPRHMRDLRRRRVWLTFLATAYPNETSPATNMR